MIFIPGRIPSKKNSKSIVRIKGRTLLLSSKAYKQWHKEASEYLIGVEPQNDREIAYVKLVFIFPDKRKADLTNKAESVMDLLVDNKILKDDSHQVVPKLILEADGVDKEKCGVYISLITKGVE